jgi:hypothetical protein
VSEERTCIVKSCHKDGMTQKPQGEALADDELYDSLRENKLWRNGGFQGCALHWPPAGEPRR